VQDIPSRVLQACILIPRNSRPLGVSANDTIVFDIAHLTNKVIRHNSSWNEWQSAVVSSCNRDVG
jgi:hypothetical protein